MDGDQTRINTINEYLYDEALQLAVMLDYRHKEEVAAPILSHV